MVYKSKVHGINGDSEVCLDKMLFQTRLWENHLYITIKQVLLKELCMVIDCVVIDKDGILYDYHIHTWSSEIQDILG